MQRITCVIVEKEIKENLINITSLTSHENDFSITINIHFLELHNIV